MRLDRIFFKAGYSYFKIISLFFLFNTGCLLASKQPKISIITSIFNGDLFIAEFLGDITKQTVFQECELILINANPPGTGHELEIILPYLAKYPKQIIYKQLSKDPGLYGVWNIGIQMARGIYLTNANLDDRLAADCYEVHAKMLDQNPHIDLVYSSSYVTKNPNETFDCHHQVGVIDHVEFVPQAMQRVNLPSFNPMWRKTLHNRFGLFDQKFKIAGDWEFWVRIVAGGAQFKKVPGFHGLFYYNTTGLSLNQATIDEQYKEVKSVRKKYANFFKFSN